ncbi:hypothetical protein [Kitasatospora sp. NPDC059571]|uniref:hypothetical protein n=1 Tax=Kitasatospora sp. NPDC059571 TaxID=3346871 RepID=UPI00368FC269
MIAGLLALAVMVFAAGLGLAVAAVGLAGRLGDRRTGREPVRTARSESRTATVQF